MRRLSVRNRISLGIVAAVVVTIGLSFLLFRYISSSIMLKTLRGYLVSGVETNVNRLVYLDSFPKQIKEEEQNDNFYLAYGDGYLEIDDGFLREFNDVTIALYDSSGELLYGENILGNQLKMDGFKQSKIYQVIKGNEEYFVYDRRLVGGGLEGLWFRGTVPLTQEVKTISEITRGVIFCLPFLLLFAIALGYFAALEIIRPLSRMEKIAAKITQSGDLKQRIESVEGKDEVSRLSNTLNEMLDRLEESFEREKRFTSDASHELRTPVSVILAQTEYSLEKDQSVEDYREALQVIQRQGERMKRLVNDMLEYTRLEQKIENYEMLPFDLSQLVETICEDMELIAYQGIKLTWNVDRDIWMRGNAMLMTRVMQNLIDNAYKYGKENGLILVSLTQGERINLKVKDNGMGIAEENCHKVFDRFYRAEHSSGGRKKRPSGNGLGLSMVKKIVEIHGGEIYLESRPDEGSCFFIDLPVMK